MTTNVAIIGSGTMGGGIAAAVLAAGLPAVLIDTSDTALDAARERIQNFFDRRVKKGDIQEDVARAAMAQLETTTALSGVVGADVVIEAIFEDIEVKADLFSRLNEHLSPDAIVATNTSALRVSDIAANVQQTGRFLGLHFFSPAEINPIVEVVSGAQTAPEALQRATKFIEAIRKTPLRCRDQSGFAINRFFCPYTNEAVRILDEGIATAAQIDRVACETFDLAIGPFTVMNIIKPRINLSAVRNLGGLGASYAPAKGLIAAGENDAMWDIEETDPDSDKAEMIATRLKAALFLPVFEELGEQVATPEAIDSGAQLALRFGKPPVALMQAEGEAEVRRIVGDYAQLHNTPLPTKGLEQVFAVKEGILRV